MQNYLQDHYEKCLDNGYDIIPLAENVKYPTMAGWQKISADRRLVNKWVKEGFKGVGFLTAFTPAVDIDCYDTDLIKELISFCKSEIGDTIGRVGKSPKTLLLYHTDTPFRKVTSKKYIDEKGVLHGCEILGQGQQFVAFNVHPDTKKPYQWFKGSPLDLPKEFLPEITQEKAIKVIQRFEALANAKGWQVKKGSESNLNTSQIEGIIKTDPFELLKQPMGLSQKEAYKMLEKKDSSDYDVWIKAGMALHHEFNGAIEGFEVWNKWSEEAPNYPDRKALLDKWSSFGKRPDSITMASFKVKEAVQDIETFLDSYVYIQRGDMVADISNPKNILEFKLTEFRNSTASHFSMVSAGPDAKPKKLPMWRQWIEHPSRKTVYRSTVDPSRETLFNEYGIDYVNLFRTPDFSHLDCSGNTDIFMDHLIYLFPNEREREWFTDWLAFNVKTPGDRCPVSPLHIAAHHGTGRGWVVKVIARLLGQWNCTKAKIGDMAGENMKSYDDYLNNSLFCAVEEVKEGGKRFSVNDRIRDLLTEDYLNLNCKYGSNGTKRVFTNFFFMSNHADALYLPKEDRRINVFSGPDYLKPAVYYDALHNWIKSDHNIAALYRWLLKRNLTGFNFQRSMDTPARRRLIEHNKTETEIHFEDWIDQYQEGDPFKFDEILLDIQSKCSDPLSIEEEQIKALLKKNGFANKRVRDKTTGKQFRAWIREEED